tara:strand:+ start:444 stop:731 length:288 start_codon:yes stop_codon:yes gene_type:complete
MNTKFKQYVTEAEATGKISAQLAAATEEFVAKIEAITKESEKVYRPGGEDFQTSQRDKYTAVRDQLVLVQTSCRGLINLAFDADRVLDTAVTQQS